MDLAYLRAHPHQLPTFLTHQRIRETPVRGGDTCPAQRLTLEDGESLFAKSAPPGAPAGLLAAEAAGLRWLREAGAAPVPEVLAELPELIALAWIDAGEPTPEAAETFGRRLADLHAAGAPGLGACWPGFIGTLPLDNTPGAGDWGAWYVDRRLLPYLRLAADRGALSPADVAAVEAVTARIGEYAGPAEPVARLHGDLWPGNLVWSVEREVWLVDPAAHGGHRETDLATLALFGGAPHLERILAAYHEHRPLADGWRERVPLHQLHLLLVHAALFGPGYRGAVLDAVTAVRAGNRR